LSRFLDFPEKVATHQFWTKMPARAGGGDSHPFTTQSNHAVHSWVLATLTPTTVWNGMLLTTSDSATPADTGAVQRQQEVVETRVHTHLPTTH